MDRSWEVHGKSVALAWQEHGKSIAISWHERGKSVARAWQERGKSMARAWQELNVWLLIGDVSSTRALAAARGEIPSLVGSGDSLACRPAGRACQPHLVLGRSRSRQPM